MTNLIYKTKLKALSLLEVIVVLLIISVTMVSGMGVVLRANAILKDNEIQDTANDILLQSFELIKSPDSVKVLSPTFAELNVASLKTSYSLEYEDLSTRNGYLKKTIEAFSSCEISSVFNVESIGSASRNFPICVKIDITPIGVSSTITRYDIIINLRYSLTSGEIQESYALTRYEKFVQVN